MDDKGPQGQNEQSSLRSGLFTVADAVLGAAVMVLIGVWLGGFIDQKLGTSPWWSLGLSMLGGGLGLWRMVVKATQLDDKAGTASARQKGASTAHNGSSNSQENESDSKD
ncbi:MAG TPA: AtpZ/AtpI family protein [Candidatus Obscuribacterales bacterium]